MCVLSGVTPLPSELVVFLPSWGCGKQCFVFYFVVLHLLLSMEEQTNSWSGLSLNDREGSRFVLQNQLRSSEFIIAAKFLIKRVLNMDAVARTFRQLWRSTDGFKIRNLGDRIVLFVFKNQGDVDRILLSEPWCFDKHLMVLQRYD